MTNVIKVVAAVVDTTQLILYKEDGLTVIIPQGDPRLATIIQTITPILAQGPGSVAEVDIGESEASDTYKNFEEASGKEVRFFRIAKALFTDLLSKLSQALEIPPSPAAMADQVAPMTIGQLPNSPKAEQLLKVTEEIIKYAKPSSHPGFNDKNTGPTDNDTIVAVIGDNVVADVQKLKPQLKRAVFANSPQGMQNFLARVAKVASERRHSVDDLLKFLERGDLPIADDGSIIIYKVLNEKSKGVFVDLHSQRVIQRVGSYVCMDPSLVDHNRNNECSNGLHVARRGYIRGFGGNVCVLAKVNPEDVIAVPQHDANKMRVCGYHILFRLHPDDHAKLRDDRPFTDSSEAQLLLGRALCGDHPKPNQEVRITGQTGTGLKITDLLEAPTITAEVVKEITPAEALYTSDKPEKAPAVDPKTVAKAVTKAKAEVETRADKAKRLYEQLMNTKGDAQKEAAQALLEYKQQVKLGWKALGLPDSIATSLQVILN